MLNVPQNTPAAQKLQLNPSWQPLLGPSREGTDWTKILQILTTYRLLDPGSEWWLHRDWFKNTALADLLNGDAAPASKDTLYRCHDLLVAHKDALFIHLANRWRDLFNPDCAVLLTNWKPASKPPSSSACLPPPCTSPCGRGCANWPPASPSGPSLKKWPPCK